MKKLSMLSLVLLTMVVFASVGMTDDLGQVPDFTLESTNGSSVSLADSNGKIRVIDFWATWCPPCRKGIPEFVELYDEYKGQGVEVIGISMDQGGMDVVRPFAERMNMNYPVLLGDAKVVADFGGVKAIPTAFVVDQKGNIIKKYIGYQPKAVFENDIQILLNQ